MMVIRVNLGNEGKGACDKSKQENSERGGGCSYLLPEITAGVACGGGYSITCRAHCIGPSS